jgi:hypothetical protein
MPCDEVPSAAELDAMFTVANGNGRLCEGTYGGRACPRDATHWVTFTFPEEHNCPRPDENGDGAALCEPHVYFLRREHAAGTFRCALCACPAETMNIQPLGGRQ